MKIKKTISFIAKTSLLLFFFFGTNTFSIAADIGTGNIGTTDIATTETDEAKKEHRYAHDSSNSIGYIDLNPLGGGVLIQTTDVLGYAWNDYLGWIRLNCKSSANISDTFNIDDSEICGTDSFGVRNENGTLKGKALLEGFGGGYIFFDTATCDADAKCTHTAEHSLGVTISTEGKISGWAWSDVSGWIDFSGATNEKQPIAAISTDKNPPSITSKFHVFTANENTNSFEVAVESAEDDLGFNCEEGLLANSELTLRRVEGSYSNVEASYTLSCADDNKTLNIIFDNEISKQKGAYVLEGSLKDKGGNEVILGLGESEEALAFQIIASDPVINETEGVTAVKPTSKIANGENRYEFIFDVKDSLGNQIEDEEMPSEIATAFGMTDPFIKKINAEVVFKNTVDLDQVDDDDYGDAIEYDKVPLREGDNDTFTLLSLDNSTISLTSLAPTSNAIKNGEGNDITLLSLNINSQWHSEIFENKETTEENLSINKELKFEPLLTGKLVNDNNREFADDESPLSEVSIGMPDVIHYQITAKDTSTTVDTLPEMSLYSTLTAYTPDTNETTTQVYFDDIRFGYDEIDTEGQSGEDGLLNFYPEGDENADWDETLSDTFCSLAKSETECNYTSEHEETTPGFTSQTVSGDLLTSFNATEGIYSESLDTIIDESRVDDSNIIVDMTLTPRREFTESGTDKVDAELGAFITYVNKDKIVKYPIILEKGSINLDNKMFSTDVTHGEDVDEAVIENPDDIAIIKTEGVMNYTESFAGLSEDVARATGTLYDENDALSDGQTIKIDNLEALFNPSSTKNNITMLSDNKIAWIHGNNFTVELGDGSGDLKIPSGEAVTIIVQGGNVHLKSNILDYYGGMKGPELLGIIILASTENDDPSKSGNLLIDPDVTNIKASVFAERSIFSYDETHGVINAFAHSELSLQKQLYWKGFTSSKNTWGGASSEELKIPDSKSIWMPDDYNEGDEIDEALAARFDGTMLRNLVTSVENFAIDVSEELKTTSVIRHKDENISSNRRPPLFE